MNFQSVFFLFRCGQIGLLANVFLMPMCISVLECCPAQAGANLGVGQLLGVTWGDGGPYRIDPNSGNTAQLSTPLGGLFNSMARSSSGMFLASNNSNQLFNIDPGTGNADLEVSVTGFGDDESIRGMAFSDDDRLFAVVSARTTVIDRFFEINLSTGDASLIGSTGMFGLQSLAISSDGILYSLDIDGAGLGLVTIDPNTGLATDINPSDDDQGSNMQSLAFSHDGNLYGMGNENAIYTIDTSNGELTQLASFSIDVRGMEFLPIPEPSCLCLLLITSGVIISGRVKRGIRYIDL